MSATDTLLRNGSLDLTSSGLLIPALQAEPFPISVIKPSPCTLACPAGINVKAYVSLIAEGRHSKALETIRRRCPLPGICGRICHHPCEKACKRSRYDEPIAIRSLKRFVADVERDYPKPSPPADVRRPHRVAIVGSGPAGLTAAYDLRLAGYPVTVFEAESEPGGMLRYGIADYRLPRDILDAEIDVLCRAGVDILTGKRVGTDLGLEELRRAGYAAMLLALGAQRGRRLGLKGESEIEGVEDALSFLRRVNEGDRTRLEGPVAVIGGGSTAVEAARTALRLGAASVEILYRRYREELLADHEEIEAAEAEGIRFRFLVAPRRLLRRKGVLTALRCVQVGLGEPDASGRRRPIEIPGSEFTVKVRRIFAAVGQEVDLDFLDDPDMPQLSEHGRLVIDEATAMTVVDGIFAGGDAVTGPATVIEAVAAGHRAAESIRHYLEEGRPDIREQRPEKRAAPEYELPEPAPLEADRIRPPLMTPAESTAFAEVERAFTADEAIAEARRCLRCGPCGECRTCATSCSRRHVMVRVPSENDGERTLLLRTPGAVALALSSEQPTPARLLRPIRPGILTEFPPDAGTGVEILPVRTHLEGDRCRACGRCVDACQFKALHLTDTDEPGATVRLEPALCRGCGLCAAACPTHTVMQSALSPEWWSKHLDAVITPPSLATNGRDSWLVLACQRRAGSLEEHFDREDRRADVVRFRCVGQIDAGMLLDLARQPYKGIVVAGCLSDRCRFSKGADFASEQIGRARSMLDVLGLDGTRIVSDWSPDRVQDPLESAIAAVIATHGRHEDGGGH